MKTPEPGLKATPVPGIQERVGPRGSTFRVRISNGKKPDGSRDIITKTFDCFDDAYDFKVLTEHQLRASVYVKPSVMPFGQWLERWVSELGGTGIKPNTIRSYRDTIQRVSALKDIPLANLETSHFSALWQTMAEGPYSEATIALTARHVRLALKAAIASGKLAVNVAAGAKVRQPTESAGNPLSAAEVKRFLEASRDDWRWPLWRVSIDTGARIGELRALRWTDCDLERGILRITKTVTCDENGTETEGPVKTRDSNRRIPLSAPALAALRLQRKRMPDDEEYVFPGPRGGRADYLILRDGLRRTIAKIGLEPRRIHDLRHTAGTLMAEAGIDAKTIQKRLGHSNVAITLSLYVHPSEEVQAAAAERTAALLEGVGDKIVTTPEAGSNILPFRPRKREA